MIHPVRTILLLCALSIPYALSVKCWRESKVTSMTAPDNQTDCGDTCHFCVKHVINSQNILSSERHCGCGVVPAVNCQTEGLFPVTMANAVVTKYCCKGDLCNFDEYAVAHCCDSDFCNSAPSRYILFSIMLSISIFIVYT